MDNRDPSAYPGLPTLAAAVPSLNSLFASIAGEDFHPAPGAFGVLSGGSFASEASLFQPLEPSASESTAESSAQSLAESAIRRRSRRVAAREAFREVDQAPYGGSEEPTQKNKRSASPDESRRKRTRVAAKAPPNAKDDSNYDQGETGNETEEGVPCCICMCEPERQHLSVVNGCDHKFCFDCIAQWADRENKCPLCKVRFSKISRVHKVSKRKGEKSPVHTKRVKERNQRSDLVSGAALEAMLSSIAATNRSSIGGPRLGRVLFAAVGGPGLGIRTRSGPRRAALFVEGESDEDSTDSGFPFPHDFNELMRHTMTVSRAENRWSPFAASGIASMHHRWSLPGPPPMYDVFHQHLPSQQAGPPRSYATNANDTSAGRAPENPLEIDDSDEDDDVVEIIEPPRSATA